MKEKSKIETIIEEEAYRRYPSNPHTINPNKTRPGFIKGAKWMFDFLTRGKVTRKNEIITVKANLNCNYRILKEMVIDIEYEYTQAILEQIRSYFKDYESENFV